MKGMKDSIREVLKHSGNIVVLSGSKVIREVGLNGIRAEHMAYEIEETYGYSND